VTEKTSRAAGPYGRGTSFGLPTSGHRGWMPVLFSNGKHCRPSEGYKNVLTNEEYRPPGGHNDAPPCPTGETIPVHSTDAYRDGWDRIWGNKEQRA
jgi:hypothetical protein